MRAASSVSVLLAIAISGRAGAGYDAARGGAEREQVASGAVPPAPARLQVSFRLDPRLTRGLYMGDRWVSPPMYSKVQDGKDLVVEARVHGLTARGAVPVHATWRSADPEIATVSSPEGNGVTLRILREGHTHVEVAYGGVSSRLAVEADLHRGLLRVNITPEAAKAALAPEAASPSLRSRSGTQKPESWKERAERNKKAGRAFLAANRHGGRRVHRARRARPARARAHDPGVAPGARAHAGRLEVGARGPSEARLRPASGGAEDRPVRDPRVRDRAPVDPAEGAQRRKADPGGDARTPRRGDRLDSVRRVVMTVSRSTGRPRVAFELEEKARPISIPRSLPARSARDSAGRGGFLVLALVILVFFCGSMALVHRLTGDPPPGAPLPPSLEAQVVTAPPPVAAPAPSTVPSAQLPAAPPVRPVATVVSPPPAEPVSTAAASRVDVSFKLDPRLTRGLQMGDRWVSPPTYTSAAHTGADVTIEARALARDSSGRPMRGVTSTWTPADPGMVSVSPAEGGAVRITVKRRGRSDVTVTSGGAAKKLTVVAFQESGLWRVDIAQR